MSTVSNIRPESGISRADGRINSKMRPIAIRASVNPYAEGSAEVFVGRTSVLITATINPLSSKASDAELIVNVDMVPRATPTRVNDESLRAAVSQELQSIERLILRSLYAVIPPQVFDRLELQLDCHILVSDAGISSAAVAGSWVAMRQAVTWAVDNGLLANEMNIQPVAAISAGILDDQELIDLSANEASNADFVANFVFDKQNRIVDAKATFETASADLEQMSSLMRAASGEVTKIFEEQEKALS